MGLLEEMRAASPMTPTKERPGSVGCVIGIRRKQEGADDDPVEEEMVRMNTPGSKGYGLRGRIGRMYSSQDEITYFHNEETGITYKPGETVYVDCRRPGTPYSVCAIKDFKLSKRDSLLVTLKWYFRPSEMPENVYQPLVYDRHNQNEHGHDVLQDPVIKGRELFISDSTETYPVTALRGKCRILHYNDLKSARDFRPHPDTFFYILTYNPKNKRLATTQGEIRVGQCHQARLPECHPDTASEDMRNYGEELLWRPVNLMDSDLIMYLRAARSMAAFAGMCDGGSTEDGCQAASMDETTMNAMDMLHENDYDTGKALQSLVRCPAPRGIEKKWSDEESKRFVKGLRQYGKNFFRIRKDLLPQKETGELVEYYYFWKKTPAAANNRPHRRHRRPNLKPRQVRTPSSNRPASSEYLDYTSVSDASDADSDESDAEVKAYTCCRCFTTSSKDWHHSGKDRLCTDCRLHFKKYGEERPMDDSGEPPPFMFKPVCEDDIMNGSRSMRPRRGREGSVGSNRPRRDRQNTSSPDLDSPLTCKDGGRRSPSTVSTCSSSSTDKSEKSKVKPLLSQTRKRPLDSDSEDKLCLKRKKERSDSPAESCFTDSSSVCGNDNDNDNDNDVEENSNDGDLDNQQDDLSSTSSSSPSPLHEEADTVASLLASAPPSPEAPSSDREESESKSAAEDDEEDKVPEPEVPPSLLSQVLPPPLGLPPGVDPVLERTLVERSLGVPPVPLTVPAIAVPIIRTYSTETETIISENSVEHKVTQSGPEVRISSLPPGVSPVPHGVPLPPVSLSIPLREVTQDVCGPFPETPRLLPDPPQALLDTRSSTEDTLPQTLGDQHRPPVDTPRDSLDSQRPLLLDSHRPFEPPRPSVLEPTRQLSVSTSEPLHQGSLPAPPPMHPIGLSSQILHVPEGPMIKQEPLSPSTAVPGLRSPVRQGSRPSSRSGSPNSSRESSPDVERLGPSPEPRIVDEECHRSQSALFIKHIFRGYNSCARCDLWFKPPPDSRLARKREGGEKRPLPSTPPFQPPPTVKEERRSPESHKEEESISHKKPGTPPENRSADAQITSSLMSQQGAPPYAERLTPRAMHYPSSMHDPTPALRQLSEYARPHVEGGIDPGRSHPYSLPPHLDPLAHYRMAAMAGMYPPGSRERLELELARDKQERDARERELRERELREMEIREKIKQDQELKAAGLGIGLDRLPPGMGIEPHWLDLQRRYGLPGMHPPPASHAIGPPAPHPGSHLPGVYPPTSLASDLLARERERMERLGGPPPGLVPPDPLMAERLSAERMQAERIAMVADPMLRLQMQHAHTHTHAHSHTHLHLHPGEPGIPPLGFHPPGADPIAAAAAAGGSLPPHLPPGALLAAREQELLQRDLLSRYPHNDPALAHQVQWLSAQAAHHEAIQRQIAMERERLGGHLPH